MFVATKRVVAVFFLVLLFQDAAQSQSAPPARALAWTMGENGATKERRTCGTEMKIEVAPQRFTLARGSYPPRRRVELENDDCRQIETPVAASRGEDERIRRDLRTLGKQGVTISRVRDQVLKILQTDNGCTAWFREADSDPAATFRSLDFGPRYVFGKKEVGQAEIFKHPYVARTTEGGGRNATIFLNAHGAFFNRNSPVLEQDRKGGPVWPGGLHALQVASYSGNTIRAQVTTLLHELGHIVARLPADGDSWDGDSVRNTTELLRHCGSQIQDMGRKPSPMPESH